MTTERDHKIDDLQHNDQSTYEFAMWEGWPSPQYASTLTRHDHLEILTITSLRLKNGRVQGGL